MYKRSCITCSRERGEVTMLVNEIRTEKAVIRLHDDSVQPDQTEKILEMIAARALAAFQTAEKTA